jgi:uncharacterized membrane protein
MDVVLTEWASLCLRWLHVVAGIAWIGSSFYFMHLDYSLKPKGDLPKGAYGEAWQVHGGGFYNMMKFMVAPTRMPDELTWFKWEAYTTWLSGFTLLVVTYYVGASLFLIDPSVMAISPLAASAISAGTLLLGWLVYHYACRSPLGRNTGLLLGLGFVFLVALCYGFTRIYSGRGTFLQMGAMVGTIMVANVFFVIIPNQKKVVAALLKGETPDPALGAEAKLRSTHNNYLTLPVVLVMIGNHYPLMFGTRYNWIIFAIVLIVGAVIRHFFNERHMGKPSPWWTWIVAAVGMAAIVWLSAAGAHISMADAATAEPKVTMAQVDEVVTARCSVCHMPEPVWDGFVAPPKGVLLDTPEHIALHAREIEIQAVLSNAMPPGNVSDISVADRRLIAAGIAQSGLVDNGLVR